MPTQEQAIRLAEDFERQYPARFSRRLEWWREVLGIDTAQVLALLGMSPAEAKAHATVPLPKLAKERREQAERLDELLCLLLT